MAEKEERIVCRVIEKGYACDYCFSRPAHKYYQCSISNDDCTYDVCKQCSLGMTHQKAINRIAKALIDIALTGNYSRFEDSCVVEDAIPYAEAALNALLEE